MPPQTRPAVQKAVDIAGQCPWPGGTTTAEAIHAGVPTLTMKGRGGMMSRNGETLLTAAGIPDWIAADEADYVAQAIRRAQDPDGLAALHRLIEKADVGHTERFFPVRVAGAGVSNLPIGGIVAARVVGHADGVLRAVALPSSETKA